MNTIFLGPPGAGKGTQAVTIAKRFHLAHISTGELLRKAARNGSPMGKKAGEIMERGSLVPDDVMVSLIREVLPKTGGFLLDGFPRTVEQAKALDRMLADEKLMLDSVIYIDLADDGAVKRLMGRSRADDKPETIQKRLAVYHRETQPLIEFYRARGILRTVDGSPPPDAVTQAIASQMGKGR